jgi:hypothetical protein
MALRLKGNNGKSFVGFEVDAENNAFGIFKKQYSESSVIRLYLNKKNSNLKLVRPKGTSSSSYSIIIQDQKRT